MVLESGQKRAGTLGRGHHSYFRVVPGQSLHRVYFPLPRGPGDPCPGRPQARPLSFSSPRCYSRISPMSYRNIMTLAALQWLHPPA